MKTVAGIADHCAHRPEQQRGEEGPDEREEEQRARDEDDGQRGTRTPRPE